MILQTISVILLAIITLISLINVVAYPVLEAKAKSKLKKQHSKHKVSLLLPCRNEEHNIKELLKSLTQQTYPNIEILIYNDNSTDNTLQVIKEERKKYPSHNIQIINGKKLPNGWYGKSHACHQLQKNAKGQYLCFVDADVRLNSYAIQKAMALQKGGLLSVFPHQTKRTFGELLTVPLMNWFLLSFLPFPLITTTSRKELVAANGQFMLFSKKSYDKIGGHEAIKQDLVEDMALARKAKEKGVSVQTLTSQGDINCRMYTSFTEGLKGFSRSFYPGTRMPKLAFIFLLVLLAIAYITPFFILTSTTGIVLISMIVLNRICTLITQKQYNEFLLSPIHIPLFFILGFKSAFTRRQQWKGRTY